MTIASKQFSKISKIRVWKENLQLTKPYTIAYQTIDSIENIFVYLQLKDGLYGIGAGSPAVFVTGESVESAMNILQEKLESWIIGKDIRYFPALVKEAQQLFPENPAAQAAVDIALHDLWTKYLDIPLVKYLGQVHYSLPTSVTIGIMPLRETLKEAEAFVKKGFKVLKLKIGQNLDKDLEVLFKLKERYGDTIKIRVDANQGYSYTDFQKFTMATHNISDVELLEQPFSVHYPSGANMKQVIASFRMRVAADEDLLTPRQALEMSPWPPLYGIYNIKLMKCGGLQPALQIANIAQLAHISLMWGCNDESLISITAALHAALACPATKYIDLDGSLDLAKDVATGGFVLKDGYMSIDENKAGLGVTIINRSNNNK